MRRFVVLMLLSMPAGGPGVDFELECQQWSAPACAWQECNIPYKVCGEYQYVEVTDVQT